MIQKLNEDRAVGTMKMFGWIGRQRFIVESDAECARKCTKIVVCNGDFG